MPDDLPEDVDARGIGTISGARVRRHAMIIEVMASPCLIADPRSAATSSRTMRLRASVGSTEASEGRRPADHADRRPLEPRQQPPALLRVKDDDPALATMRPVLALMFRRVSTWRLYRS
jgi:hypothetical protein